MVNGTKMAYVKEEELRSGKTAANMWATGRTTRQTERVDSSTQTETSMRETGSRTRHTEEASTSTSTVQST